MTKFRPSRSRTPEEPPDAPGRPEYAAAFLQRNRTYRAEHAQMKKRIADGAIVAGVAEAAFARRWGLSFRRVTR